MNYEDEDVYAHGLEMPAGFESLGSDYICIWIQIFKIQLFLVRSEYPCNNRIFG